jgi:uracil-DNA glycosylase
MKEHKKQPIQIRAALPILKKVEQCRLCAMHLPHTPRPVVRASASSRLLIVGQAPGRRVHETGIPWNDPSGDLLRSWLRLTPEQFYDERRIAIVPTGFCYPGTGRNGDLPPRPECAPHWHPQFLKAMPEIRLTLLIGAYAQKYYLQSACKATLTDTVAHYAQYLPRFFPLPHPSPRNRLWLKRNPWFEQEALPVLRQWVTAALTE